MWRMSGRGEMAREDDFGVQASPVARKRPVGQTQPGALLTSPPWGASGQPGNMAARPRIVRGRVPSTRERGVCTPLTDTPEHGPASPSSLRDAPRAGARFAQGNGVHAVGHAGDFLIIFLKKKKPRTRGKRRHGQTAHGVASPTPRFVRHRGISRATRGRACGILWQFVGYTELGGPIPCFRLCFQCVRETESVCGTDYQGSN